MDLEASVLCLQNSKVRFGFDRKTGSLIKIEDILTNQEYMQDTSRGRLFRVMCPTSLWQGRYADSHEAAPPMMDKVGQTLTIYYSELITPQDGVVKISAKVLVELPDDSSEAIFSLEITNNSSERLHEIRFPWIAADLGLKGRTVCRGVYRFQGDDFYPSKSEQFEFNLWDFHRRDCTPSTMIPFLDISANGSGLSYISYHKEPIVTGILHENLNQEPGEGSFSFSWVYYPFVKPGHTWKSPHVGIGVHPGDWHATAERYRKWADTWWKSPETSRRLRASIGFQNIQIHRGDGLQLYRYQDIPKLAKAGLKYGVEDLCLWTTSHMGIYFRPPAWDGSELLDECDPLYEHEDLCKALAELKQLGVNSSALVNFSLIHRQSPLYQKIGEENIMRTYYGAPVLDEYSDCTATCAAPRTRYLARHSSVLCQKTDWFKKRKNSLCQKLLDMGYASVFIDQAAANWSLCFAENHRHNSPDDVSGWQSCKDTAEIFKKQNPEAYIIGEDLDVFFSQVIDVSWCWSWNSGAMHPEIMRYTFPECLLCIVIDHQPAKLNKYFAMGFLVAFTSGKLEKTLDDYPEFGQRVLQLAKLRKQCADFIVDGRFRDKVGLKTENDILYYVYESPKGIGVIIADKENKSQKVRIELDPSLLCHSKLSGGMLYKQDGSFVPAGKLLPNGNLCLEYDLPALEVAVWTIPFPKVSSSK